MEYLLYTMMALALLALIIYFARAESSQRASEERERQWLPDELRGAELLFSEPATLKIRKPVMAAAKVDRAYRVGKTVVLVELKTRRRHRVYDTDTAELSVQRLVLEGSGYGPVADVAYVVTEHKDNGSRRTHAVTLFARQDTIALVRRYHAIRKGVYHGQMTEEIQRCATCAHQRYCRPAPG